ncbi:MAG: hypothetical protein C3F14_06105, partial [Deltaproteobacteria bacterium]
MKVFLLVAALLIAGWSPRAAAAPAKANVAGEIERFTVDNPADPWSSAKIQVGGQVVIIPRNLLMDLPANRMSAQAFFAAAPAACVANGESGVAKGDLCNKSGVGGFATISANRAAADSAIVAGDVLIQKGVEAVTGIVTYVAYDNGYFRIDGVTGDPASGTMVRLNDPTARHTIQQGPECLPGSQNCSPDPRFTLDPDNYTNVFSSGYPYCIPSTVSRTFADVLGLGVTTAQASANGTGDVLCPSANNPTNPDGTPNTATPANDSRLFGPIKPGNAISVEGNYETINGVRFLSVHTSTILRAVATKNLPTQPDYLFLEEEFIDAPAFYNQRGRTLNIGFTTLAPTDVLFWTIHYDPATNSKHEFPYASVLGCDAADAAGTCSAQGLAGAGANIFRIRHDLDFILAAANNPPGGAKPRLSACLHIMAEPRFNTAGSVCSATPTLGEEMAVLMPIPHEIQARTGHRLANPGLITLDVSGSEATNGQYLFPFGINLGGVEMQEFVEVDLNLMGTPNLFEGIPWNLDRRLSPGGCLDTGCEATPQPLDPFPVSGLDPRTALNTLILSQAGTLAGDVPHTPYSNANYTAGAYSDVANRMLGYVDPTRPARSGPAELAAAGVLSGNFNGNSSMVSFPPANPGVISITPAVPVTLAFIPTGLPATGATLTATPAGPQPSGAPVAFTATGAGGSGTYEYQFSDNVTGVMAVTRAYGPASDWIWNTTGVPNGIYSVMVDVRSFGSTSLSEASATVGYTIAPATVSGLTLSASPASPIAGGDNVVFTASAAGTDPYEYQFLG